MKMGVKYTYRSCVQAKAGVSTLEGRALAFRAIPSSYACRVGSGLRTKYVVSLFKFSLFAL